MLISLLSVFSKEQIHVHPVACYHWLLLLLPGLACSSEGKLGRAARVWLLGGSADFTCLLVQPPPPLALPVVDNAKHVIHESLPHEHSALGLFCLLSALFHPIPTPDLAVILCVLKEDRTSSCVEDKTLYYFRY